MLARGEGVLHQGPDAGPALLHALEKLVNGRVDGGTQQLARVAVLPAGQFANFLAVRRTEKRAEQEWIVRLAWHEFQVFTRGDARGAEDRRDSTRRRADHPPNHRPPLFQDFRRAGQGHRGVRADRQAVPVRQEVVLAEQRQIATRRREPRDKGGALTCAAVRVSARIRARICCLWSS